MNRQKELARNTLILTIGKLCTQMVSFLLLPLYTALLDPAEFGIVDIFNSYILLLTPLFNWQFENGLFRFMVEYRNSHEKQRFLFSTVFLSNILQSILYLLFFIAFQSFISSEYKIFLAIDVVCNIFLNTLLQFSRGLGKSVVYSFGSFLSATATIVLNVLLIAVVRWGVLGMFIATVTAKIITCIYLFIVLKSWNYLSLKCFSKKHFKEVFNYSLPLVPNQLSWWVIGTSDRTIIIYFLNVATNGIYSFANKFSSAYVLSYNIFNLSWTESVSLHLEDSDRDVFLTDIINTIFNLFVAVDIGIIACIPFIINFFNEKYWSAYQQIPILMLAGIFQVVIGLYSVIYVALKKSKEIAKTSAIAAVINIVVDLVLIKYIGLYAASISTLVAYASMAIYRYIDIKKYVDVKLKPSNVLLTIVITTIVLLAYYQSNIYIKAVVLAMVVVYAIMFNWNFIKSIMGTLMAKLHSLKS